MSEESHAEPKTQQSFLDVLDQYPSITSDNTAKDIEQLFHMLYPDHTLDWRHFEVALRHICDDVTCTREDLSAVLHELKRRMILKEKVFWDFQILDHMNNGSVSLDKARSLFKIVHGDDYSMFWDSFVEERVTGGDDVVFKDIELFLCSIVPASTFRKRESRY